MQKNLGPYQFTNVCKDDVMISVL